MRQARTKNLPTFPVALSAKCHPEFGFHPGVRVFILNVRLALKKFIIPQRVRRTPDHIPSIYANLPFPTPMIISFTSPSFLPIPTDSVVLGVLNYCWISPAIACMVINHKGEQFMPFTLFDGRPPIQVVILLGQLRFNHILSGFDTTRG